MKYVLGIDLGTGGVKALLLTKKGEICSSATVNYSPDLPAPGYSEQDPKIWWEAVQAVIADIVENEPNAKGNIAALACSGQMHSSVFLDKEGEVIRKAILWNDTRTTPQVNDITVEVGQSKLLQNVYNIALEGFTLPKLLWLRDNERDNYDKLSKLIMPKDYINYKLTGVIATEKSDAAGTLMYDVKNCCPSDVIFDTLGLDKDIMPPVLNSTDVVGKAKGDICSLLGDSCLVIAGGADNSCAAVGSGMVKEGQGVVSVGTSGTVIGYISELNRLATGQVHLFNYSMPDSLYAMGCMLSAGESLNWLKRTLFSSISFEDMNVLAEKSDIGSNGLIFLPYLFGERTPHNDPNAKGVFFGLSGASTDGDIIRSVMEGVAFGLKDMLEEVEGYTTLKELTLTGGGAKSPLWAGIIADVLNKPVKINEISEGPSLGAAFIALVGSGLCENIEELMNNTLKAYTVVSPSEKAAEYKPYYEIYRELYRANKDIFKRLSMLRK